MGGKILSVLRQCEIDKRKAQGMIFLFFFG